MEPMASDQRRKRTDRDSNDRAFLSATICRCPNAVHTVVGSEYGRLRHMRPRCAGEGGGDSVVERIGNAVVSPATLARRWGSERRL